MSAEADLKTALWQGGDSALADLFDECLSAVGKPVDALSKADRLKIVAMMDQKNAFSYRKSVPFAARRLGVSRYTVYKYLDELAQREGASARNAEHGYPARLFRKGRIDYVSKRDRGILERPCSGAGAGRRHLPAGGR
ncbi:MAG: helix-turn-helix domain-containing protein [Intestinimonas sp.]